MTKYCIDTGIWIVWIGICKRKTFKMNLWINFANRFGNHIWKILAICEHALCNFQALFELATNMKYDRRPNSEAIIDSKTMVELTEVHYFHFKLSQYNTHLHASISIRLVKHCTRSRLNPEGCPQVTTGRPLARLHPGASMWSHGSFCCSNSTGLRPRRKPCR